MQGEDAILARESMRRPSGHLATVVMVAALLVWVLDHLSPTGVELLQAGLWAAAGFTVLQTVRAAMAAAGLLLALLGRYLGAEGHFLWMPAVFLLSIPLALWSPDAAKYAWLLIMLPVFWHPAAETRGARRVDHGSVGRG